MTLANYRRTEELARELDEIAAGGGVDLDLLDYGRSVQAAQLAYRGETERAAELLGAIRVATLEQVRSSGEVLPTALFGSAMRAALVEAWMVPVHYLRGDPEGALASGKRACEIAHELGEPLALGLAYISVARMMVIRRDPPDALEPYVAAIEANVDAGEIVAAEGVVLRAYVDSLRAPLSEAAATEALRVFRARSAGYPGGTMIVSLALIAALRRDHPEKARALRSDMIAFSDATGERLFRHILEELA